ncbi:MAG: undecaprenyl-phosphate glucose phosphotransferase [Planctomycetota bacterium]
MLKEHSQFFVALTALLDVGMTAAAWLACYWLRFHSGLLSFVEPRPPGVSYIADVIVVTLLLVLLIFAALGLYRPRRIQSPLGEAWNLLKACLLVWGAQVVISHFLHSAPVSRKLQGMFLVIWPALMVSYRGAARLALRRLRRGGRNIRSCAIVGAGRLGQTLLHTLRRRRWSGYQPSYFVDDRRIGQTQWDIPVRGPIAEAQSIFAHYPVDAVFVALGRERAGQIEDVLESLSEETVDVNVVPDLLSYHFLRQEVRQFGPLPIVNLTHSRQSGWNAVAKRVFDVVVSLTALIVLSPLMALLALGVKLTGPGPVFYRQSRAGLGEEPFSIYKFRSMVAGAEQAGPEWGAGLDDPRITPLGRILRKLSLDELPQLLNVLRGDMSLVGPRPERPEFIRRFRKQMPRYMLRHHVKAGMTGWAQVNGQRGRTDLKKRLQFDLDYINRWSFGFDLWILVLTVVRGFIHPRSD